MADRPLLNREAAVVDAALFNCSFETSSKGSVKPIEVLRQQLANQNLSDKEPGLDPIIAKGHLLIKDVERAIKQAENPGPIVGAAVSSQPLRNIRVQAGLNLCHAYVNCYENGKRAFQPETLQELKNLMEFSKYTGRNVVDNKDFCGIAYRTRLDDEFLKAFDKAGGDRNNLRTVGQIPKQDMDQIVADIAAGRLGSKLETAVRTAYNAEESRDHVGGAGGAGALSSLLNHIHARITKEFPNSKFDIDCRSRADTLSHFMVISQNEAETRGLVQEFVKNNHQHTKNTKDRLFEIKDR